MDINTLWYKKNKLAICFYPVSLLYRFIMSVRHKLYFWNIFSSYRSPVPVVIVGNLTVGGTGKTPMVIALVALLQREGFTPGVISRGYAGKNTEWPCEVFSDSDPILIGDEPLLIAKNTKVPVFVGPSRMASSKKLLSTYPAVDIIISDDGLAHLKLQRDIEVVVVDGLRRFGNGYCLPAGPLREPLSRLSTVDFIVANGNPSSGEFEMRFHAEEVRMLVNPFDSIDINSLKNRKLIALAGIGNPDRFFNSLKDLGLVFDRRIFPDHHHFSAADIACESDEIIIMTEKDAVKCSSFAHGNHYYLKGSANLSDEFSCDFIQAVHQHATIKPKVIQPQ